MKKEVSAEERVKERVAERWQALIEGRLETAYSYLAPDYRKVYSYQHYARLINGVGMWKKAVVDNVKCDTKKCIVTVTVYVTITFGRGFGTTDSRNQITENWLKDPQSEEWYHVPNL